MRIPGHIIRRLAVRSSRFKGLYRRICRPSGEDWAELIRERKEFYSMGEHCSVDPHALITTPGLVRLGNNVRLASCAVFCHDGSVNMINRAFALRLDNVGPVDIRDNVFIGYRAIILPGVTIGPNAIVAAGSVVRSNVAEGDIVAGVPAKRVGRLDMTVAMLKAKCRAFPWMELIENREGTFDPDLEPQLIEMRVRHFFGQKP